MSMQGFSRTDRYADPGVPWHALDAASVLEYLVCDAAAGLSSQVVVQRAAEHGPNALPEPPKRAVIMVFLHQFVDEV